MPRKTKKDKIKKSFHQPHTSIVKEIATPAELPINRTATFTFTRKGTSTPVTPSKSEETDTADFYVRRDLVKTVTLAFVAISILIALSFTLH